MAGSYSVKTIRFEITLGEGSFSGGGNQKTLEGFACEVTVEKPGLPEKNSAKAKIWGLPYEDMASLTMLSFRPLESQHNTISIYAGERGGDLSLAFSGEITAASADFNAAPDVAMDFECDTGTYAQQKATPMQAVDGEADASQLFEQWAKDAGYSFKNEGLATKVRNAVYPGSSIEKMRKLARDIDCELIIDDCAVVVMPAGQAREGEGVLLNAQTGLVGYPTFNQDGISCKCVYNPALQYGGVIKVESIVPKATGEWKITKLTHSLSAYKDGPWESQIEAASNE